MSEGFLIRCALQRFRVWKCLFASSCGTFACSAERTHTVDAMATSSKSRRQRKQNGNNVDADMLWRRVSTGVWEWLKRTRWSESQRDSADYVEFEIFLTPPQSPERLGSYEAGLGSQSSPERRARGERMLRMHDCIVDDIVSAILGDSEPVPPSSSSKLAAPVSRWKQTCSYRPSDPDAEALCSLPRKPRRLRREA
jgi:hypothetical protein